MMTDPARAIATRHVALTTAVLVALGLLLVFVGGAAGGVASPTESPVFSDRSVDVPNAADASPGTRLPLAPPGPASAGAPSSSGGEQTGLPARDTAPAKRRETVRPAIRDEHGDDESDDSDGSDDIDDDAGSDEDGATDESADDTDDVNEERPND